VVLENSVIHRLYDACVFGCIGQLKIVVTNFLAQDQPSFCLDAVIREFLTTGLDRKIRELYT
jgi:hypothetical protein